ncbi:MAG: hypothetical protein JSV80_16385 [Acidobacteriota bacterium]|nr:MAG: hypothetical protein JSV80_16385 [Acidobacteriota bacterium]
MRRTDCVALITTMAATSLLATSALAGPLHARAEREGRHRAAGHRVAVVEQAFDEACSDSAKSVLKSCRFGATADLWLAVGKCQNLADEQEREECADEAKEALNENKELCRDQYDARLEICEALGGEAYEPQIDPEQFVERIDHPLLPYAVGSRWVYEGQTEDGFERIVVEVTDETREILGVTCTVVRDRVYLDGELIEDTFDWYAQDAIGNVWYFGELSYELEDGVIVSLAGSWESGIDGAHPGIVMPATPVVGDIFRQEYLLGEAEDMFAIASLDEPVGVPYGDFASTLQTEEWTPIEPEVLEFKYYAHGVGLVLEENLEEEVRIELVEYTAD